LALAAALVLPVSLAAQPAQPLTLSAAVARALAQSPALAAGRARAAEAREALGEARFDKGPVLSANLLASQYRDAVPVTPIHGFSPALAPAFDDLLVQGNLQATYTLFDAGVRRQKMRLAEAQGDAAGAGLTANEQWVAAQVAALYSRVLAKQEAVAAQRVRRQALLGELDRVGKLIEVGKAPEVDRLRAEAALALAEAEAARVETEVDTAERDLARWLAAEPEATRAARLAPVADPGGEPAPRGELQARAVESSPLVARARAAIRSAEASRALARTAYFPRLRTSGTWQELAGSGLDFSSEWNVGLQLVVPLWDGGVTDRRVARADVRLIEARAELAQADLDARAAVDRAWAALRDAGTRGAALERAERRLVEVARIQKLLLEVGSGTQVDYLSAEAELAATRAARAEAGSAAVAARVELARATGELSLEWLTQNLEISR
jgi:outer membrane protein TolC